MTSDRPYRQAMSVEQAVAELCKFAGSQFDPDLLTIFCELLQQQEDMNHIAQ
jgi:HD-GYP domain-containing protein (c-di-GMP phosphodiesterase class II)